MTTNVPRLVLLASGSGTNAEAIMRACADSTLEATVIAVVTNNPNAGVIDRAGAFGVPVEVVEHSGRDPQVRARADERLIATIASHRPDLVVLVGWMRILGAQVGAAFPILNLHPALPGAFPGVGAIDRAYDAWTAGEIDHTGVMVHQVPDEGVDVGPVVVEEIVEFRAAETREQFTIRMHHVEHRLIVAGIKRFLGTSSRN